MFKHLKPIIMAACCLVMAQPAYAACSSPAGVAGEMGYNVTGSNEYEYCDNTNWIFMHRNFTVSSISAGQDFSCGLGVNEKAYCWGDGAQGRLGSGNFIDQLEPVEVHDGENTGGLFIQISTGDDHGCGIGTNGKAYCWGQGNNGRLGNNLTALQSEPVEVHAGENTGGLFIQINPGNNHSCGIGTNDKGYCWGEGTHGRLGNGNFIDQLEPVEVHAGENTGGLFTQISLGSSHSCGIGTDGKAYCWGQGSLGQLGNNQSTNQLEPVLVHNGESAGSFKTISAGQGFTCGIGADDKAYCWGRSEFGQLGDNQSTVNQFEPVLVHNGESAGSFKTVSSGTDHTCGIGTDDKAYCWGRGGSGRLGNSAGITQDEPVTVSNGESAGTFSYINAGGKHTCATGPTGTGHCWGQGNFGQLGNNLTVVQNEPVEVHAGENIGVSFATNNTACTTANLLDYNTTTNIFEWCDGSILRPLSAIKGTGGCNASGSLLTGIAGTMQYDTTNNRMVFCDGSGWVNIPY